MIERLNRHKQQNLAFTCTTSGKMTKSTIEIWSKECFDDIVTTEIVLLVDSWGGQKD